MSKKTKNETNRRGKKPKAITGFWHSDGMESQDGLKAVEDTITSHSNPTEEDVSGIGSRWRVTPGKWTGLWHYASVDKDYMTADQQAFFFETVLDWPKYNNPAQGNWEFDSVEVCILNRRENTPLDQRIVLTINFVNSDTQGYAYSQSDLDQVIKRYSEFLEKDPCHTIVNVRLSMRHDGNGNPNGDPNRDNAPREVPFCEGKFRMSSVCMHNKIRQVLRGKGYPLYVEKGRSMKATENLEVCRSALDPRALRHEFPDILFFGSVRTGGGEDMIDKE